MLEAQRLSLFSTKLQIHAHGTRARVIFRYSIFLSYPINRRRPPVWLGLGCGRARVAGLSDRTTLKEHLPGLWGVTNLLVEAKLGLEAR